MLGITSRNRSGGPECHGVSIHAVAQSRRLWAILEHVPKMPAAASTMHLSPRHEQGIVARGADGTLNGLEEARPPGAGLELGLGPEEGLVATGTDECTLAFLSVERTAACKLGPVAAQDPVLRRRKPPLPFAVWKGNCVGLSLLRLGWASEEAG